MFLFLFSTFINLVTTGHTGWTTANERRGYREAMAASGQVRPATSDAGAWQRHLDGLNQPQPESWRMKDDIYGGDGWCQ